MKTIRLTLDDSGREFVEFSLRTRESFLVTTQRCHLDAAGMGIWSTPSKDEEARLLLRAGPHASGAAAWRRSYQWAERRVHGDVIRAADLPEVSDGGYSPSASISPSCSPSASTSTQAELNRLADQPGDNHE